MFEDFKQLVFNNSVVKVKQIIIKRLIDLLVICA